MSASEEILSKETRRLLALGALLMQDETARNEVIAQALRIYPVNDLMTRAFEKINWTKREDILPLVESFELIRKHVRHTMLRLPFKLDESFAKDGFRFNKQGKLVRLKVDQINSVDPS